MSAPLFPPNSCCQPQCDDSSSTQVPGPPGTNGATWRSGSGAPADGLGSNGDFYLNTANGDIWKKVAGVYVLQLNIIGQNAYSVTSANFTVPAVSGSVAVEVLNSSWAANGQVVYVTTAGYYTVTGIPDSTHLTLTNLGYSGNAAPTTIIAFPQAVAPGGLQGPTGPTPSDTLNDLSPTTTKADILVDNGSASPSASVVRFGVGTDGKVLVASSGQPTGLAYNTITPNSVVQDNAIPRYDGTSGVPMPLQDSFVVITDTGAIQASGSGGNARGTSAVDLQVVRSDAANVASGATSVVGGGQDNRASATNSTVAGGQNNDATGSGASVLGGLDNTASGTNTAVAGGDSNVASNTNAFVGGGDSNTASAINSTVAAGASNTSSGVNSSVGGGTSNLAAGISATVAGGNANTASGPSSAVPGGIQAIADKYGQISHAAGRFADDGDSQASELIWRTSTTNATPTELFLDGSSLKATVPIDTTWGGKIIVVGRSDAGVCAVWEVGFGIQNNANTVSLVDTPTVDVIADGTGATWGVAGSIAVTADNVSKNLKIMATGAAVTNIRFTAHASFVEVSF